MWRPPRSSVSRSARFVKTQRQRELLSLANSHDYMLAYGGARSGKTAILVRNVFLRAVKAASNHLMIRRCYNHARTSLGRQTVPFVLDRCFRGVDIRENKNDGFWTVPVAGGGESYVWLGGTDASDRMDKLLGNEYSTVYVNECSQVPFDAITLLESRLAENSGLQRRLYLDCNPMGKKHWTYQVFFEGVFPDGERCEWDAAKIQVNPAHNLENLPVDYLKRLERLPKRQRQRFLEGLYLSDVEGALWTDQDINVSLAKEPAELVRTVIAVDPSVTARPGSDECGIMVCSEDEDGDGVVHRDCSGKLSTPRWARRVVNLYELYSANRVVAEANQGGDLVRDVIQNIDPSIRVDLVHAHVGKVARAEPVAGLYEQGRIAHERRMPELEAELTETVFDDKLKVSPNRLDALTVGLTALFFPRQRRMQVNV